MSKVVYPTSALTIITSLWSNRSMIWQMTRREVLGRYQGSVLGLLWSFFHPILMLAVYTFVFSVVFPTRWGESMGSKTEFAMLLFAGLIVHSMFADCINRSPNLILTNANYVKKVVFPLEILPWVALASALFHTLISIAVLLVFFLLVNQYLHWTVLLLPLLFLPFLLLTIGLSWFLAATGVYLRDVGQTTGVITTVLLFLSPIFYPVTALPVDYQILFHFNPLTFVIEQTRDILIWGKSPNWKGLALYLIPAFFTAWAGLFWFQKTRKGFADVL